MKFKEKLTDLFGGIGLILYFIVSFLFPLFAIAMITNSFDLPSWTNFIFTALLFISPSFFSTCFLIVGLIGAIMGPQDILAIIYYIIFSIGFAPTFINIIVSLAKR